MTETRNDFNKLLLYTELMNGQAGQVVTLQAANDQPHFSCARAMSVHRLNRTVATLFTSQQNAASGKSTSDVCVARCDSHCSGHIVWLPGSTPGRSNGFPHGRRFVQTHHTIASLAPSQSTFNHHLQFPIHLPPAILPSGGLLTFPNDIAVQYCHWRQKEGLSLPIAILLKTCHETGVYTKYLAKIQSNGSCLMLLLLRCFYIASFNMFRPFHVPRSYVRTSQ